MNGVILTPDIAKIFHRHSKFTQTLNTVIFMLTPGTVKYLYSTLADPHSWDMVRHKNVFPLMLCCYIRKSDLLHTKDNNHPAMFYTTTVRPKILDHGLLLYAVHP